MDTNTFQRIRSKNQSSSTYTERKMHLHVDLILMRHSTGILSKLQRISVQWNWSTTDDVNSKQLDASRRVHRRLGQHQKLRPTNMMINFISRRSTFIDIVAAVSTPRCLISCWTIVDLVTTIASFIRVQWRLDVRRLQTKLTIIRSWNISDGILRLLGGRCLIYRGLQTTISLSDILTVSWWTCDVFAFERIDHWCGAASLQS